MSNLTRKEVETLIEETVQEILTYQERRETVMMEMINKQHEQLCELAANMKDMLTSIKKRAREEGDNNE